MAKKSDKIVMSKKDFMKEHKRLTKVLKSKSRKDDKEELHEQLEEMKKYVRK